MKISVYGSGCPTCKKLYEITQKAASEMSPKEKVEYVSGQQGMQKIIELGAMSSPVLAVNGKIAMTGFTSDISKIKAAIQKASKED
ncbi:MAG: thioredoxin family protein [archaeon]